MKTIAFTTLGCKVNQYETQAMRESFCAAGYREVSVRSAPSVLLINTCTVTRKADRESRARIRAARAQNPGALIVAAGCYAQDAVDLSVLGVDLVVANERKKDAVALVEALLLRREPVVSKGGPGELSISGFFRHQKAFLKIQDGCDNFCAYCRVPFVRGRPRSREANAVCAEVERLVANGFQEIVLTGICLGRWEGERGEDLQGLLSRVIRIPGKFRIRLSSIEPKQVSPGLIELIAGEEKICGHFHIPLQSGDDHILKMMNRRYSVSYYLGLIGRIRQRITPVALSTDILIGFPGEREEHFERTMDTIRAASFSRVHVFRYSERKGTAAAALREDIPREKDVRARSQAIMRLGDEVAEKFAQQFIGKRVTVLVESRKNHGQGGYKGYTEHYVEVVIDVPSSRIGTLVEAEITDIRRGEVLAKPL